MKKVFSLITLLCFLTSNVSFALSPPMISGDLGEGTHQNKFLTLAKMGLKYELKELHNLKKLSGVDNEKDIKRIFEKHERFGKNKDLEYSEYTEHTAFTPAKITTSFFRMVEHIGGNLFRVPVAVEKNGVREDYQLLFSTIDYEEGGFPVFFCTKEQFKKLENSMKAHNRLPYREENEAKFIDKVRDRYEKQDEEILDKLISDIITKKIKGGDFTEIEERRKKLKWGKKFPEAEEPDEYLSKNFFSYLKNSLNPFFSRIDKNFNLNHAMKGKNLVLIKLPEEMDYPVIEEDDDGEKVRVRVFSHTSNNAVYLFLKAAEYDLLQRTEFTVSGKIKGAVKREKIPLYLKVLLKNIVHEIGSGVYGARWFFQRHVGGLAHIRNDFDAVYDEYLIDSEDMDDSGTNRLQKYVSHNPVDLNELFWRDPVTGKYVLRDHATGKSIPSEQDSAKKLQEVHKKRLAMSIAHSIYPHTKQLDFAVQIDMRFRIYLDAAIAHYVAYGTVPQKTNLDFNALKRNKAIKKAYSRTDSGLVNIDAQSLSEELDEALREKVVFIVKKIVQSNMYDKTRKQIDELMDPLPQTDKLHDLFRSDSIEGALSFGGLDQIQNITSEIRKNFYGSKDFSINSPGIKNRLKTYIQEIHVRETNPYRQIVEEDLADSINAGKNITVERVPGEKVKLLSFDKKEEVKVRVLNTRTGEPIETDLDGAFLARISEAYKNLDLWADVYGTTLKDDTSWKKYFSGSATYYSAENVLKKVFYEDFENTLLKNAFDLSIKSEVKKLVLKNPDKMIAFKQILHFCVLPERLQEWIKLKYEKISKRDASTMFDIDDTVTLPLMEFVIDWLRKARDEKIFISMEQFFASPRTMQISHTRGGFFQEDAGEHVGEYFLREFLLRKEIDSAEVAEDFALFMFNAAMHVGNSIVRHRRIETSLDEFHKKIEHIEIPAVDAARKKWANYARKPWEPMADADGGNKGIFVGKSPEMITAMNRVKGFVSSNDECALIIEGAEGGGKSHLAKAVRGMMSIDSADGSRYYKVDCRGLSELYKPDDNRAKQYIHDLFFGKLYEWGTENSSILGRLCPVSTKEEKSLLVFDHIEKANDYIFTVLKQLLNDPEEINLANGKVVSAENLKILILAGEQDKIFVKTDSVLYRLGADLDLEEQIIRIPELCNSKGEPQCDIVSLAENFNFNHSVKKHIPWARIEKDMGDVLIEWIKTPDTGKDSARDLEKIIKRLTETRKVLRERIKNNGDIGTTDIFGRKINLRKVSNQDDDGGETVELSRMFSPYLMTIVDLLYSGLKVPDIDKLNEKINPAIERLHEKFQKRAKDLMIYPYFKDCAPHGFYYGERLEQPGMNDAHPLAPETLMLTETQLINYKQFVRQIARAIYDTKFDVYQLTDSTRDKLKNFVEGMISGREYNVGEEEEEYKLMAEANLRFKTYVDQALAKLHIFYTSGDDLRNKTQVMDSCKKELFYDWPLYAVFKNSEWCDGAYWTTSFPAELNSLLRDAAVELVKKADETSDIGNQLTYSSIPRNALSGSDVMLKFNILLRTVSNLDNARIIQPIRNRIIKDSFGVQDNLIDSEGFLNCVGAYLFDMYEKEANSYWKAIEKHLGDFVDADRAFEMNLYGVVSVESIKTGDITDWPFKTLDSERFSVAVMNAYEKLNFWADMDMDDSLNLSTAKGLYAALNSDILNDIRQTLHITEITAFKKSDYSEDDINEIFFRAMRPSQLKRVKQIIRFHYLPKNVRTWILEKKQELSAENLPFSEGDEITPRLLDYVTDCANEARKSMFTIVEGTFFVSPDTNTHIHDGRGISTDTRRVWMGEYFLRELAPGTDDGISVEEFALVFLNAGMHMENWNVSHGEIKSVKDIGAVNDHIPVSDKYDKAARAWWKYAKNPYPWRWVNNKYILLDARIKAEEGYKIVDFIEKPDVRSLLIQGKPGSGLSTLAADITKTMWDKTGEDKKQIKILNCEKLLRMATTPDNMRTMFFGGYMEGQWRPGILEKIGYAVRSNEAWKLNRQSLLVIDNFHLLEDALEDSTIDTRAMQLLAIFQEILKGRRINLTLSRGPVSHIDISNLKTIFVSNRELSGNLYKTFNPDKKITFQELWEWEDEFIAGLAEEFSREESEKAELSWAPLEENTTHFIIDHVKKNKLQIKGLQEFMKAVIAERAEWMREWEKTRKIPETLRYGKLGIDTDYYHKCFSPYFTSFFFVPLKTIEKYDNYFCISFLEALGEWKRTGSIKAYFKEFMPLDAKGENIIYYSGPFRSKEDGTVLEQPGMHPRIKAREKKDPLHPYIAQAVKKAMEMLPEGYRKKGSNGIDHKHVARAMHDVPYLKSPEVKSVMNYLEEFFAGYLFRGEMYKVRLKKVDKVSEEMKKKKEDANLMNLVFKNPPKDFDKAVFIDVNPLTEKTSVVKWDMPPHEVVREYSMYYCGEKVPITYHICAAIKKTVGTNNVESIHVEVRSNQTLKFEQEFDIQVKTPENPSLAAKTIWGAMQKRITSNLIDLNERHELPAWMVDAIDENVIDLSRFAREEGALVFSEKVTFDHGAGALLSKLALAEIKVAVVARKEEQKQAIDVLNRTELADSSEKIVVLDSPAEARDVMNNVQNFYYFRVKEDRALDMMIPDDFSVNDITGMVEQVLQALGRASGIINENEIRMLQAAAEQFAQSV